MARFITRIELHEADSSDYDTPHQEMKGLSINYVNP